MRKTGKIFGEGYDLGMATASGIRSVLSDISEKQHICQMCRIKNCPQEKRKSFQNNFKARSCPEFSHPRYEKLDMATSWERRHDK